MTNKFTVTTDDAQALTNKDLTGIGNTFPTFNQNTTGNAATATKLATARNINGVAFDGSADITVPESGYFNPADYGFIAWNYDPSRAANQTVVATAGEAYLELLPIRKAVTVTNVIVYIGVAGASLTSGQCFAGLFDKNGNLLSATADQSTNWQTSGLKVMALTTPQAVSASLYYVGWFVNGTTPPKFGFDAGASSNVAQDGQLAISHRSVVDTTNTGLTTGFHSPVALTPAVAPYWAAVS